MSEMAAKTALRLLQISGGYWQARDDPPDTFNAACIESDLFELCGSTVTA